MTTCVQCFCESGVSGRELQKLVDEKFPSFVCEAEKCSPYSAEPVSDAEEVAFILIDPLHYDEVTKTVVPEAFRELTANDLSVLRVGLARKCEANKIRNALIARGTPEKPRRSSEACIGNANDIRQCSDDSGRLFGIYDTALEDIPGHASVFTRGDMLATKLTRGRAVFEIHKVLSANRLTFDDLLTRLKPDEDTADQVSA